MDNRGDRIENRGDRRDDWHDSLQGWHNHHGDWHHGCWDGNWGGGSWWNHMWDDHTALMAFGTTMWGINRAAYAFGYWGYSNPYYTEPYAVGGDTYIDYSQPIYVDGVPAETPAAPGTPEAPVPGMTDFNAARQAFYEGKYPQALAAVNKALAAMPNDPIMHEFRALVQFAQGNYKESAAGLYGVLSVGPGFDWTTMSSLYPSVDVYTAQLRALEGYLEKNPQANDARFVLAYHYTTAGSKDAAAEQYKILHKNTPQDNLIKQLALMTAGPEAVAAIAAKEPPKAATTPAIDVATLQGKWAAAGPNGAKFSMDLAKDGTFNWSFVQNGKTQTVKGVYALDGNTLAMEMDAGGTMLADITPPQNGGFSFQMLGAPPGDPGLKFVAAK